MVVTLGGAFSSGDGRGAGVMMASGIEVRDEYGGLLLDCDEEAFARIRGHVLAEPSLAEVIGAARDDVGARFISIRAPAVEAPPAAPVGCP